MNTSSSPINILMIEDDLDFAKLVGIMLQDAGADLFKLRHKERLSDGLDLLAGENIDVVLLDLGLPDSQGLDTFEKMIAAHPQIPILVMTGRPDSDTGLRAVEQGGQDFLPKDDINSDLLARTIQYAMQRQHMRDEIARREANLRTLLECNTDSILVADLQGRPQYMNPAAESMFGECIQNLDELLAGIPLAVGAGTVEDQVNTKQGKLLAQVRAHEVEWDGAPARLIVLHDITERQEAEEARRKLEESRKVAEALNQFVDLVVHELRTPMTAIGSSVQLLLDGYMGTFTDKQRQFLEVVDRNINRLKRFSQDVLSLSKLESGTFPVRIEDLDLNQVVRGSLQIMEAEARSRGKTLTLPGEEPRVRALADADALAQVLTNLVSNALMHCPRGTKVAISLRPASRGEVEVLVSDDGAGIPDDALATIFERFSQARQGKGRLSESTEYKGTGLGLAMCKSLVERMGGQIRLESTPGQGTTFYFTLPGPSDSGRDPGE